jgi:hypothetical protein
VACSQLGATNLQLASLFSVKRDAIYVWRRKFASFSSAVVAGKDIYDTTEVEKSLLKRAIGFEYDEVCNEDIVIKGKGKGKSKTFLPATKIKVTRKMVVPDTAAIIFWLKNRQPERWKDISESRVDMKLKGSTGVLQIPFMENKEQWLEAAESHKASLEDVLMEKDNNGTYTQSKAKTTEVQRT